MDDKELIKGILHYQQCLDKYTRRNDEARVLYCLSKLYKMPINIGHLQETGVGRTVNALRKHNGEIAEAAKTLVGKWKEMVAADTDENDSKETSKSESIKNNEHKEKHKAHKERSSSSHRDSDKKKSRSNSSSDEDSKHSYKKVKEETKYKHHESNDRKQNKDRHEKHKSSKRKRYSTDESEEEDESDHEVYDDNIENSDHSTEERDVKVNKSKQKHSKRDSSLTENENHEHNKSKRKKYSQSEESEDELESNEKKHSHKSSKHHRDKKDKLKHEHKKEKKEKSSESKINREETKPKEKHYNSSTSNSTSSSKHSSKSDKKNKDKESKSDKKSKHESSKNNNQNKKPKKSSSVSHTMGENGIGSGSGASFAEALGMLMPTSSKVTKKKVAIIHPLNVEKSSHTRDSSPEATYQSISELVPPKKLAPLDIKLDNLLPEISPNYRPLGYAVDNGMFKNKFSSEDETLSAIMYNKISRTKVYSGNKIAWGKVPTLFEICTRVLQDNIDALEYTGGVPYLILKPVIERANPDQLFMLEHHNPYLIEETDELWQLHCNKEFRTKKREEMETWRDMYMRCLDEREAKLKALTANIKQSQDKSLPVRQTKLAYVDSVVKPPRNIARKQAKHGTGGVEKKPIITPSSRLNALATSGAAGQIAVPNPGPRAVSSSGSSAAVLKPKKAPLMQKTLALMKSRIFRR